MPAPATIHFSTLCPFPCPWMCVSASTSAATMSAATTTGPASAIQCGRASTTSSSPSVSNRRGNAIEPDASSGPGPRQGGLDPAESLEQALAFDETLKAHLATIPPYTKESCQGE